MKFKLNDSNRAKLLILLDSVPKLASIKKKLLTNNEVDLTDTEVSELILLGLNLND